MSNDKVFQSICAATLKAREVEENVVYGIPSTCSSADRKDLIG